MYNYNGKMLLKCLAFACLVVLTLGYRRVNRPPHLRCPSIRTVYTADKGRTDTGVTWKEPTATDPDGGKITISRMTPHRPGSRFSQGRHTVLYEAEDNGGLKDYCTFSFTVQVIQCDTVSPIPHGVTNCGGRNYGSRCTFSCDEAYRLKGARSIECQRYRTWTHSPPICVFDGCSHLSLPPNSKRYVCTNGKRVGSICWLECDESRGYAPVRGEYTKCLLVKTWTNKAMKCVEIAKQPQFQNCPTQSLVKAKDPRSVLTTVMWEKPITAKDNSGKQLEVKSLTYQVNHEGGVFSEGTTLVVLTAQNSADSATSMCSFAVTVQEVECEAPTFDDEYLSAPSCIEFGEGRKCQLQCYLALRLIGPKYIECKRGNSTAIGFWSYVQDNRSSVDKPYCEVRKCPQLTTPNHGAMSCSGWDLNTICTLSCRRGYDIPTSSPNIYFCNRSGYRWSSEIVPDCDLQERGGYFRMKGYNYYNGTCSSAMKEIRTNFITIFSEYISCRPEAFCSVEHVDVRCGDEPEDERWRKRSPRIN